VERSEYERRVQGKGTRAREDENEGQTKIPAELLTAWLRAEPERNKKGETQKTVGKVTNPKGGS